MIPNSAIDGPPGSSEFDEVDSVLAEWASELADRIRAGEPVDQEYLAARHPEYADQLRHLVRTIKMMTVLIVPGRSKQGVHGPVHPEVGRDEHSRRLSDV